MLEFRSVISSAADETGSNPLVSGTRQISQIIFERFFLMKFYVYILYSASLDIYCKGFSTDAEKRLEYHLNSKHKFTSQTTDWVIVYVQVFAEKETALNEEKRLKKLNRKFIEKLIG